MGFLFRKAGHQHYSHEHSFFRAEPRKGYLDRSKRVVSFLANFEWATIRTRTEEPDFLSILTVLHDWEESVCDKVKELIPYDAPAPLGNHVVTIRYHNVNLCHNVTTGRSVTGVLLMLSKTTVDWHNKK